MWNWYLRWRHSKGFGVHSPYAYRFVTDVVRPSVYGFYSYGEIDDHLTDKELYDYKFIRSVKFTIRLVNFLKSTRIVAFPVTRMAKTAAGAMNLPLISVEPGKAFNFKEGDLFVLSQISAETDPEELISLALEKGIPVFALDPSEKLRHRLEQPLPYGLLLHDRKKMLLIPRKEMAYVAYPITLKAR